MPNSRIKKITISQLKVGMYVHDLNCDWMTHPFFRSRFPVTTYEEILRIVEAGIKELYVDTGKGLNVRDARTKKEVEETIEQEIIALASEKKPADVRASFADELVQARSIKHHAQRQISSIMLDARMGKVIELDRLTPVVKNVSESVLRNTGALIGLLRIKNKDDYTFLHSVSVCALMIAYCRSVGMAEEDILEAGMGGLLHDIGKSRIADSILNKEGPLTDEEFSTMKHHSSFGHEILQQIPDVGPIPLDIALHHHERHDGSGYPDKLPANEIQALTQMAAIADVYDAITSDRSYHSALPAAEGLRKLYEWSQHHFNPQLVQAFIRCIGIYPVGTLVRLESGRLGVVIEADHANLLTPKVNVFFSTKSNTYISPEVVDLARPLGAGGGDRIMSHESPEKWNVDPVRMMNLK
ncbi:MAG: HD-GYP domain-containing protein [Oxalobacter sp.]|nr:MAG: HD-GYP domain-containing protein [Oxalobacter sp.]